MRWVWLIPALAAVVLVFAVPPSAAQPPIEPKDGKLIIPFTVTPAAEPIPSLKYLLLPDIRDVQPGNQIPAFYKCFFEQHRFYHDKDVEERRYKWLAAPLANLAGEKELIGYGGSNLKQADYAARLESVDWQILNPLKSEGPNLLLPDLQPLRSLAQSLQLRMRGEIARREYDAAIRTAQTLFALARTLNEHPTLIGQLVGLAIANIALGTVEELVQQPGAPNLFWALTDLPSPFIDLRKGLHGERNLLGEFNALRKTVPLAEADLLRLTRLTDGYNIRGEKDTVWEWFHKRVPAPASVAAAKDRLVKFGYAKADLNKMLPLQVVMMDDFARFEQSRDDITRWNNVPFWKLPADAGKVLQPGGFFQQFTIGRGMLLAKVRLEQRFALLRAAEAVRAYAATHGGKLPATLDATGLPVPVDPVTGQPLAYEVKGDTAILHGTPPAERKDEPAFNRIYHITLRK